jgi:hypothetical protein
MSNKWRPTAGSVWCFCLTSVDGPSSKVDTANSDVP